MILSVSGFSHAENSSIIKHDACFKEASDRYQVDKNLLIAVAKTESNFKVNAVNKNSNGTEDYGVMQINSWWLDKLHEHGIAKQDLLDPCTNIRIGSWIMANNFFKHGKNWETVGGYNVGFRKDERYKELRKKYAKKVHDYYQQIIKMP